MKYEEKLFSKTIGDAIIDFALQDDPKPFPSKQECIVNALVEAGARFPICKTGDTVYEIVSESIEDKDCLFGWKLQMNHYPVIITEIRITGDSIRYYTERYRGKIEEVKIFTLTLEDANRVCYEYNKPKGDE